MTFYDDISKDYDDIFPISKDAVGFIKVSIVIHVNMFLILLVP